MNFFFIKWSSEDIETQKKNVHLLNLFFNSLIYLYILVVFFLSTFLVPLTLSTNFFFSRLDPLFSYFFYSLLILIRDTPTPQMEGYLLGYGQQTKGYTIEENHPLSSSSHYQPVAPQEQLGLPSMILCLS